MAAQSHAARFASVTLTGKGQNTDHIRQIMDKILNLADCSKCGRIALLRVDFLGDPPPDLAHDGIISFTSQGLGAH